MADTPDPSKRRLPDGQRITFLGSQPPSGPPRNANAPVVRPTKRTSRPTPDPRDVENSNADQPAERQRFPAILLIAPGFIALLFAASAPEFVGDGSGTGTALLIGFIGMVGAIACFGTFAAFSKDRGAHTFCAVMIGIALLAYANSFLQLN